MKKLAKITSFFSMVLLLLQTVHYQAAAKIKSDVQFHTPIEMGFHKFSSGYSGVVRYVGYKYNMGPIFDLHTTAGAVYILQGIEPESVYASTAICEVNSNNTISPNTTKGALKSSMGNPIDGSLVIWGVSASAAGYFNQIGYPQGNLVVNQANANTVVGYLSELVLSTQTYKNDNALASTANNGGSGFYFVGNSSTLLSWTANNGSVTVGLTGTGYFPTLGATTPTPTSTVTRGDDVVAPTKKKFPSWAWILISIVAFIILMFIVLSFVPSHKKA